MKIQRKIEKMSIDLELEDLPSMTFTTQVVNFTIEGSTNEEIEEKTDELRKKLRRSLVVLFPKIIDVTEK